MIEQNFVSLRVCSGFLPSTLPPGLKISPGLAGRKSGGGRLKRKLIVEVVEVFSTENATFMKNKMHFLQKKAFLKMFSLEILEKTNLNISQKRIFLLNISVVLF